MTDKPRAAKHASDDPAAERVVIRDKRKIDPSGGKGRHAGAKPGEGPAGAVDDVAGPASPEERPASGARPADGGPTAGDTADPAGSVRGEASDGPSTEAPAGTGDKAGPGPESGGPNGGAAGSGEDTPGSGTPSGLGAELQALRADLDERTRDLQRVTAEYANYRKRVDRDRGVAAEQTTGAVLSALLPVLDDLDRARDHGDLVGPFAAVAEQVAGALTKFGLTAFGEKGDPFDPTRHEAVAHLTSAEVTEPTCIDVMRRGYLLGERLLRPAMVAVADPE